ncbi:hypothetical protein ASG56_06100 [Rhodococcus sp. Leaf7]|uniref:hypothetical protein n=1 Tax=unclassified Rhodococcus (in: high G+C Gram-positive bacteria) TaxID=192944 RepID=UPI0006F8598F|nr:MULTISPECIES: hypothetical protein [unclassified Rhodococcus (in: high G+C Gram-positive bacteria)]KQU07116.1 hypothetical protein ASG56_06100 [Rhodococcus sp. Leaf7]KQU42634.1 hypothetical protein ASG64_06100 [Rhodococcus sp. Leaf247]
MDEPRNTFALRLVEFAEQWAHYDEGGLEFIPAEFGLTVDSYFHELRCIVARMDTPNATRSA